MAAGLLEVEVVVLAVNLNVGLVGSHSAVVSVTEVEALVAVWLVELSCMIKEVILVIEVVGIMIISVYAQALISFIFLDELQTVQHTAVITECILLALDGLELACVQIAAAICIVPEVLVIIVLIFVQVLSRNYLEPALAYAGTIFNTIEVLPGLGILGIECLTGNYLCRRSYIGSECVRIGTQIILIQRPLSYHCAVLVESVLLTIDSLILGSVAVLSEDLLTIGFEVEPTCLILIIVECSSGVLVVIVGCFIVCDIQL